jgi:hypothetical protein
VVLLCLVVHHHVNLRTHRVNHHGNHRDHRMTELRLCLLLGLLFLVELLLC